MCNFSVLNSLCSCVCYLFCAFRRKLQNTFRWKFDCVTCNIINWYWYRRTLIWSSQFKVMRIFNHVFFYRFNAPIRMRFKNIKISQNIMISIEFEGFHNNTVCAMYFHLIVSSVERNYSRATFSSGYHQHTFPASNQSWNTTGFIMKRASFLVN